MSESQEFKTAELDRRAANLIRFGAVKEVDYAAAKVRVEIGELITAWLPWLTQRAGGNISWHAPEIGEQVLVLSPSGDMTQAVVLMALYQTLHPANGSSADKHTIVYADGCVIEYDRAAHHLKAVLPAGGTIELVGDLTVTGNIVATGEITDHTRSMQADRAIYNEHDHADPQGSRVSPTTQTQ